MAGPLILVVDDDFHITDLLEGLLRSQGFEVRVASDGDQALDALADGRLPALVLLDLMLPKKDGFVVLDSMRRDPRTKAIPVLVVSARDLVGDVDKAFAKGATEFLIKPLHTDRLLAKIRKHLGGDPRPDLRPPA